MSRKRIAGAAGTALLVAGLTTVPAGAAPAPTCQGHRATIVGTPGPDRLVGTSGPDVIVGLAGRDVVRARGGDDVVCGGVGADALWGGPGDDRLHGGRDSRGADRAGNFLIGDRLRGGPGDDLLDLGDDTREGHEPPDTVAYDGSARSVVVDLSDGVVGTAVGEGTDTILLSTEVAVLGSPYDDTITGSDRADQLAGGHGDDTVDGGAGDDTLSGDDQLGPESHVGSYEPLDGASDDDVVRGGTGNDVFWSDVGHDELRGGDGRDLFEITGTDPTSVYGGADVDAVTQLLATAAGGISDGGPGKDYLTVVGTPFEGGSPRVRYALDLRTGTSSVSSDTAITGTVGGYEEYRLMGRLRWAFFGTPGDDRVWALAGGPLRAETFGGDDWMIGTTRVDHLDGGAGADEADGRERADTCISIERGAGTC